MPLIALRKRICATAACLTLGIVLAALVPAHADTVVTTERKVTQIADHVYTIRHVDSFPGWVNGNTTVIIGEREVLVVDSCLTSAAAREDIAQIRKWTSKPVRFLVNTHWHQDHTSGNKAYREAYPALAIVARKETVTMLENHIPTYSSGIIREATSIRDGLKHALDTGKAGDGRTLTDAERAGYAKELALTQDMFDAAKDYDQLLP
ncbi:MAG: MBL fold metallo-hydrolase, partial [Bryobacteraceae bacterium]